MATFVTHDGVELAYEDRGGNGFPLVMLHGWGQTQAMFRHQLSGLAPDRRIVTLDMRGHGRSAKPHFGYRIARLSRDVYELLDHLGLERFDALGWSMGVSIWWSFIDQHGTDRIRRFIAVDQPAAVAAVPWMSAEQQTESGAIFDVAALVGLGEGLHGPEGIEVRNGFVRSMFSGESRMSWRSCSPSWTPSPPTSECPCSSTTARRTGAPSSRASTSRRSCSGATAATSPRPHRPTSPSRSPTRACTSSEPTSPARTSRSGEPGCVQRRRRGLPRPRMIRR